jgi:hypothetical protein
VIPPAEDLIIVNHVVRLLSEGSGSLGGLEQAESHLGELEAVAVTASVGR